MRHFRSKWGIRIVALVLLSSVLPVSFAPSAQAAERVASILHENWWKAQVRAGADFEAHGTLSGSPLSRLSLYEDYLGAFVRSNDGRPVTFQASNRSFGPFYIVPGIPERLHTEADAQLTGFSVFRVAIRLLTAGQPLGP